LFGLPIAELRANRALAVKKQQSADVNSALRTPNSALKLGFAFGFAQTRDPVAFLPLTTLFEQLKPFKALQDIPFSTQGGGGAQTTML
jgi:hypothetical protein